MSEKNTTVADPAAPMKPDPLPKRPYFARIEVEVLAEGYREAAEATRAIFMSQSCPTEVLVQPVDGTVFDRALIDLSD